MENCQIGNFKMVNKSLFKNLSYTTVGMILYNIALWILGFIILRILGTLESGYYSVAMSIGATLYGISLWGLRGYIVSNEEGFYYGDYIVVRLISILISIVALIVIIIFSGYNMHQNIVVLLYSVFKFSEAMIELFDCLYQRELKMDINAKSMIIRSILLVIVFFIVLSISKSLIFGLICMIFITILVLYFYNYKKLKEINFKFQFNFKNVKKIILLTLPIMCFEMLSALNVSIPRLRYANIGDMNLLGVYSSIYTIIIFLQLVIQILIVSFAPYMAKDYLENKIGNFIKKVIMLFGLSIFLAFIAEVCVYFLGEFVIGLLYGNEIAPYYSVMYLAIISGTTLGMTWIFSQLFVILKKNYIQLICIAISVLFCFYLSNKLVVWNDLNSISIVLIYSNIIFCVISILMIIIDIFKRRKK